jgi:hypothetical protein
MERLIEYWITIKPIARRTPSSNYVAWNPNGQSFSLTWGRINSRLIELKLLRAQIIKEAHQLITDLHDIVPGLDISLFKLSQLRDTPDAGSTSLFDIDENIAVFQPYIDQVWDYLGKNDVSCPGSIYNKVGKIHQKKGRKFLAKLQSLLEKILAHLLKTSGISARTWQAAALLYRPYGDYGHNVWLLPHGVPVVGNPKAKQMEKLIYAAFWALAPHLGLVLFFYIGVYRPVEIEIMEAFKIPTEEHRRFIFVYTHARPQLSTYVYDGKKVNWCLENDTTPELAYETRALRNVQQAIVDKHFTRLHHDAVRSLLADGSNNQAQHTASTHDTDYAVDQITRGMAMPLSSRDKQMAVSYAFHAWFGFTPRNLDWDKYANYQPAEDVKVNETLALDTARRLVIEYYHVADGSQSARCQRVRDLNSSRPFLIGTEVSHWRYLSIILLVKRQC